MFGGGLVEGAKNMKVTDILGNMPDPTQFGVHGDVMEAEKTESSELVVSADMVQMTGAGAESWRRIRSWIYLISREEGGKAWGRNWSGDVCEVLTSLAPLLRKEEPGIYRP